MISRHVPSSGIKTVRDRFNCVGPGVVGALTAMLTLTAGAGQTAPPHVALREGEIFEKCVNGLRYYERVQLVLSVMQSRVISGPFFFITTLTPCLDRSIRV